MNFNSFLLLSALASTASAYYIPLEVMVDAPEDALDACSATDLSVIVETLQGSFTDFSNDYLSKGNFEGFMGSVTIEDVDFGKRQLLDLVDTEGDLDGESLTEEEDTNLRRQLVLWGPYNAGGVCGYCGFDDYDGRRHLRNGNGNGNGNGNKSSVQKMVDWVNNRTRQRLMQAVKFGTSDSCQATSKEWDAYFSEA